MEGDAGADGLSFKMLDSPALCVPQSRLFLFPTPPAQPPGVSDLGSRVQSFGFRASIFGFRVSGFGVRVSGLLFRTQGSGSRVWRRAGSTPHIVDNNVRENHDRSPADLPFKKGVPLQGCLAHKKHPPPWDHHRSLGTGLL